ncbi:hypothetical protein F5X98DRAFT_110344 [Xylaria grammica]|nr:hypothetical protein F5X98DRAFT_110344 [Xylaria grammica]
MSRMRSVGPLCLEQTGTEPKTSQPPTPVLQKPVVRYCLDTLTQLRPHRAQAYIHPKDWSRFKISCGPLIDLSWKSQYGGAFLRLIPYGKMQEIAGRYGFDCVRDLVTDPRHPFHNSAHVATYLGHYLFSLHQGKCLTEESTWGPRGLDDWERSRLEYLPDVEHWQVGCVLNVKNGHFPHTNCTLVERDKLNEDTLMFSEVWSILMLTLLLFCRPENEKHEVVPVTVITISGTTFRIVQGIVDAEGASVRIRKSRIVPLDLDKKTLKNQMMLLVSWLLADPVWPGKH